MRQPNESSRRHQDAQTNLIHVIYVNEWAVIWYEIGGNKNPSPRLNRMTFTAQPLNEIPILRVYKAPFGAKLTSVIERNLSCYKHAKGKYN